MLWTNPPNTALNQIQSSPAISSLINTLVCQTSLVVRLSSKPFLLSTSLFPSLMCLSTFLVQFPLLVIVPCLVTPQLPIPHHLLQTAWPLPSKFPFGNQKQVLTGFPHKSQRSITNRPYHCWTSTYPVIQVLQMSQFKSPLERPKDGYCHVIKTFQIIFSPMPYLLVAVIPQLTLYSQSEFYWILLRTHFPGLPFCLLWWV